MLTVRPRLNPFLFSPDTNFRFILLVVSVLGASLFVYYSLYSQLYQQQLVSGWLKCFSEAEATYPLKGLDVTSSEYVNQSFLNNQFINNCNETLERPQARWIMLRLGLLLLVAVAIYWFMPAARIRRDNLTVFTADDDPEIMTCLLDLCRVIGLPKRPTFLLRALNSSPSGLAFGRFGRYYVVLNGGLIPLFYQDQERFKAIVLHELAHLRNRDVDKTYFALSVGISFLLVTLIPLFVGNLASLIRNFTGNISFVLWQTFSVAIYIPIIYVALASILRSREIYADARVLILDPQNGALRSELFSLSSSQNPFLTRFLGLHPNPAWRLKVFDEPDRLFGLSPWDAFLAGIISTFALRELDIFLSILFYPQYESYSLLVASLFFVPFVVSIVGLGVWEKVFASQVHGQKLYGFGRSGLSLGAGMLTGMALSFSSFIENSISFTGSSTGFTILFNILVGILFLISLFLIFRWVATGAFVWLETVNNEGSLRRVTSLGLFTTGVMMSFWVGGFYLLFRFGYEVVFQIALLFFPALQQVPEFSGLGLSLYTESILASLMLLPILLTFPMLLFTPIWLFPLLSRLRKSRINLQNVFIEEGKTMYMPAKIHSQLRPFSAFLAGVIVATGFLVIMALLRVLLHFMVDQETRTTLQWLANFRIIQIGLAIFWQVILAIILSAVIKALGWAHGLFAALVAGGVISLGIAALIEIGDCVSILQLGEPSSCINFLEANIATWIGPIIVLGWFFSLLPAFIASWIGSLLRNQSATLSPS
jgi:Zn-dependent protease with chaperone function